MEKEFIKHNSVLPTWPAKHHEIDINQMNFFFLCYPVVAKHLY